MASTPPADVEPSPSLAATGVRHAVPHAGTQEHQIRSLVSRICPLASHGVALDLSPQCLALRSRQLSLKHLSASFFSVLLSLLLCSCSEQKGSPEQRAAAAKALFDRATKEFHLPSAQATGPEKARLEREAAATYQEILRQYPDQSFWAAQALRNLGNLKAAQTNVNEAIRLFSAVADRYPKEDFEVLQAWKSAADLLWDAQRHVEALGFYRRLVQRFDGTNQPAVVRLVVKGSKARLASQ